MVRLHDGCTLIPQWVMMGMFDTRIMSGRSAGKHQHHSCVMHSLKQKRCTMLPWKEVRGKCSAPGKSSSVNFNCAAHEDCSFLPYPKVKGEGKRWKSGPETHIFNTLVYFTEVRDCEKVSEPPSLLTLWN